MAASTTTRNPAEDTETHLVTVETSGGNDLRVYFTAPYYIEADRGEAILNGQIDDDSWRDTYTVTLPTYLGTEITYTVTYEVTGWGTPWDSEDEDAEVPTEARATITHD